MLILLLALSLTTLALLSLAIWWTRWRMLPALHSDLAAKDRALGDLRWDLAVVRDHVAREAQARETERRAIEGKIGSFLPDDAQARKVEQAHKVAQHRFLSGQTPPPPSSRGSVRSGRPSAGGTSTPGARSSRNA